MTRSRWLNVLSAVALVASVFAGALVIDTVDDDVADAVVAASTVRPVPVLGNAIGSGLSQAVSLYGLEAFGDGTRGVLLGAWGAAFSSLIGPDDRGPVDPPLAPGDDPRPLDRGGVPDFVDPCAGASPDAELPPGCPDDGRPGSILSPDVLPANRVFVIPFPGPGAAIAAECGFADVRPDEVPVAVLTRNPGTIELTYDGRTLTVESEAAQRTQWEDGLETPPPAPDFVAHCIAVPDIATGRPVVLTATATDDDGGTTIAEVTIGLGADRAATTLSPLDDTLLLIDAALPADPTTDARVSVHPAGTNCAAPVLDAPRPSTWRSGADGIVEIPEADRAGADRPYLDDFPRLRRMTIALPEGEPSVVCIIRIRGGAITATESFVATPPDARRMRLSVSELDLDRDIGAGQVVVLGRFGTVGWIPCGVGLPAVPRPGGPVGESDGQLCSSGGDSGAIAAAGGVIEIEIRNGTGRHVVGIALSARPGGPATETYRLPIPAADFAGVLCTAGVEQPSCVEPGPSSTIGSLEVLVQWDEGPIGPSSAWRILGSR